MTPAALTETLDAAPARTVEWLLAPVCGWPAPPLALDEVIAPAWRSLSLARFAIDMNRDLAAESSLERIELGREGDVCALLSDRRGRQREILLTFESSRSGRLTRLCVRPILEPGVHVRRPDRDDLAAMTALEQLAPVRRDDGTEVVIDHNGRQFDSEHLVRDHRWLAAFHGDRMLAVQGVAIVSAPIGGAMCRVAYNHYSRSDPRARHGGNHIHLVATLYRDVYPAIDQFVSIVDAQNGPGLRLSFGTPWPTRVRRLFLPVARLAEQRPPRPHRRPFDPAHAAAVLNATHAEMNLWVPRTPEFLVERGRRAPSVYASAAWRLTADAALAIWPSGERRTYRRDGTETVRTLAPVLDYGCRGERGREELSGLLCQAAGELRAQGISHLALFVSDDHPPTAWLAELAEAVDTYVLCSPALERPAIPAGPTYVDHVLF